MEGEFGRQRREVAMQKWSHAVVVGLIILIVIISWGSLKDGLQRSQLADPTKGPVRYSWMEKGVRQCVIFDGGNFELCSTFTPEELNKIPIKYERPPQELLFGCRYC